VGNRSYRWEIDPEESATCLFSNRQLAFLILPREKPPKKIFDLPNIFLDGELPEEQKLLPDESGRANDQLSVMVATIRT